MERLSITTPTLLKIARIAFVVITTVIGTLILTTGYQMFWLLAMLAGAATGGVIVLLDIYLKNFSFRSFSHATVGLLVGILCAWLITQIGVFRTRGLGEFEDARQLVELVLYLGLGFIGMMLALRSNKEEFSLLIPYVRFRQDAIRDQPLLIDVPAIVDGKVPRLGATGFIGGILVIPDFVLEELQSMADSRDETTKERGKRGLESLNQMKQSTSFDVVIQESGVGENGHPPANDARLIRLAQLLGARLLTTDADLTKVARLQSIPVLSLTELAVALRPTLRPGDEVEIALVKGGKEPHQAVGYLQDGTMIVVNQAAKEVGKTREVVISGATKTSAGRLVFAELKA